MPSPPVCSRGVTLTPPTAHASKPRSHHAQGAKLLKRRVPPAFDMCETSERTRPENGGTTRGDAHPGHGGGHARL